MNKPVSNARCHRCGNSLGFGSTILTYMEPSQAAQIPADPTRDLERLRQQLGRKRLHLQIGRRFGDDETFCRRCGAQSPGLTGLIAARRPGSRYEDAEGRTDIPRLLSAASPLGYGLKGRPLGLTLRELDWNAVGIRRAIGQVRLRYAADGPGSPQRAIDLNQGFTRPGGSAEDRLLTELQAIVSIVTNYGSDELREEYRRKGNIHRDWTTLRLRLTGRRRLTLQVDQAPVEVEIAHWWDPEPVALAHLIIGGHPVLATAVGMTHVELLAALKTLVSLQNDPQTLAEHQQQYQAGQASRAG